jgi:hypothetical protein
MYMAEEELRRKQPLSYRSLTSAEISMKFFDILQIDRKKYITDHVNAYEKEQVITV